MKWKFVIDNGIETREVHPLVNSNFNIKWTRDDERRYDFRKEVPNVIFLNEDYNFIYNLQKNNQCYYYYFRIYLICGPLQEDDLKFEGSFNTFSAKWDLDQCQLEVKITPLDAYKCIDNNDDEINLFELGLNTYTVNYDYSEDFDTIDNGMKLKDVLQNLLNEAC